MKKIFLAIPLLLCNMFMACEKKSIIPTEPSLQVQVQKSTVEVGEAVVFEFAGDADIVSFYSGEMGSDYRYLEGRTVPIDRLALSFESRVNLGEQENQLSVLVSQDFNPNYNAASLEAATWTDVTGRFTLGTESNVFASSGEANLTDLFEPSEPLYFAYKYVTRNQDEFGKHRNWTVQNFDLRSTTALGEETIATQRSAGFQIVEVGNPMEPDRSSVSATTGSITLRGNLNDGVQQYTEHWAVSGRFDLNEYDAGPDRGVVIKQRAADPLESYTHVYNEPGTYKAVFLVSNQETGGSKYGIREVEIVVTPHTLEVADFVVTWPLTSNEIPTKSEIGAADVTGHNVYVGSAYRDQAFTSDGLVFSEGITSDGVINHGYWVGRTQSNPDANFTAPFRNATPPQPVGYETEDMYVEFAITADQGKDLKISEISIPIGRVFLGGSPGGLHCNMAYSLDGFSTDVNYLLGTSTTAIAVTEVEGDFVYNEEVIVPQGQSLAVRFMVWRRNSANVGNAGSAVRMNLGNNVFVKGTSHRDPL